MRRPEIIVAVLHSLAALFVAGCVAVLWVTTAMLAPLVAGSFIPELIAAVGRPMAILRLTVAAIELAGACRVIARPGSRAGRLLLAQRSPAAAGVPDRDRADGLPVVGVALERAVAVAVLRSRETIEDAREPLIDRR